MTTWSDGYVHANGIDIHYYRSSGGNNKPAILFLHGFTDSGLCWTRVARDLEGDYDVIMTDARGHGRSSRLDENQFSTTLLADDAAAVIRALALNKPYLFGHSMGAITSAAVAATYPELVRALVLEDPPFMDMPPSQIREGDKGQPAQNPWQWVYDVKALSRDERIARAHAENPNWVEEELLPWADSKAEFDTAILERGRLFDRPWRDIVEHITCPVLLITGEPGRAIVTPQIAQEAVQHWTNGEIAHISGAGHNIHRDRYDETMAAVRAFLQRY
jgi:N-formylmaleamate deformylase